MFPPETEKGNESKLCIKKGSKGHRARKILKKCRRERKAVKKGPPGTYSSLKVK